MPSITPSLWFDNNLEEAAEFYTSIFPNSSIEQFQRYTEAGPGTPGDVVYGTFVLDGQRFLGINGGPEFSFSRSAARTKTRWTTTGTGSSTAVRSRSAAG
jgi:predicted 3-demethylubiquinone-9 3-methyltransferase (glyoxalase superfamily)